MAFTQKYVAKLADIMHHILGRIAFLKSQALYLYFLYPT